MKKAPAAANGEGGCSAGGPAGCDGDQRIGFMAPM